MTGCVFPCTLDFEEHSSGSTDLGPPLVTPLSHSDIPTMPSFQIYSIMDAKCMLRKKD